MYVRSNYTLMSFRLFKGTVSRDLIYQELIVMKSISEIKFFELPCIVKSSRPVHLKDCSASSQI